MTRFLLGGLLAATLLLSAGCASTQKRIPLSMQSLSAQPTKVGVVLTKLPKPDTQFPGAACLLCYAAASVVNSGLTTFTATLPVDEWSTLPREVADRMKAKGIDARAIDEPLLLTTLPANRAAGENGAPREFGPLADRYGVDKLVVVEIATLGFERPYSGYVPQGDPKGLVRGVAYLVDLKTNRLEWYTRIGAARAAEGTWDEPPKYPGLANAYFQVVELTRDSVLENFE